jgi:hypothetical protein
MDHELHDSISLELARQTAARLRASPELLAAARANLDRWSRLNANAPSLQRCYAEWREILERPIEEICELLCAETGEGQRLARTRPLPACSPPPKSGKSNPAFAMRRDQLEHIIRAAAVLDAPRRELCLARLQHLTSA